VWLVGRDFRACDNIALNSLAEEFKEGDTMLIIFVYSAIISKKGSDFLKNLLKSLPIKIFQSDQELDNFLNTLDNPILYYNEDLTPWCRNRDAELKSKFRCVTNRSGYTIYPIDEGKVYKVFAPYYKLVSQEPPKPYTHWKIDHIVPSEFKDNTFRKDAINILKTYAYSDNPSRLSVYMRNGLLSAREAYHGFHTEHKKRELLFREFYYRVYWQEPRLLLGDAYDTAFDQRLRKLYWSYGEEGLNIFKMVVEARTGNRAVDDMVRDLYHEGYLTNRKRMALAMYFTKTLALDWRWGDKWFAHALIDYDPIQNSAGWQWAASVGVSPSPYFVIMNPCNIKDTECSEISKIDLRKRNDEAKQKLKKVKNAVIPFIFHQGTSK
jgi:deoxyribodipyrimidine photolyase